MGTIEDSKRTRSRLIEAAGTLFAERGTGNVTVRDIAHKAATPLGAISYHFKTKDALYKEVLLTACRDEAITSGEQEALKSVEPLHALYLLVLESLKVYRKESESNWRPLIITRECREPSVFFPEMVQGYLTPQTRFLCRIVGGAAGKEETSPDVRFAVLSLMGLLETFGLYGEFVSAVAPEWIQGDNSQEAVARKITDLVIHAAKEKRVNQNAPKPPLDNNGHKEHHP